MAGQTPDLALLRAHGFRRALKFAPRLLGRAWRLGSSVDLMSKRRPPIDPLLLVILCDRPRAILWGAGVSLPSATFAYRPGGL